MKKIYTIGIVIIVICVLFLGAGYNDMKKKYDRAMVNIKSYELYLNEADSITIMLNKRLADLNISANKKEQKLLNTIDSLKIKRKRVQQIQYIESTFKTTDTIYFRDSIYEPLDTTFGNDWYQIDVIMADKFVTISPSFKSEKHVIVENRKETIESPKKFFLFRWFQKKHWVQYVTIVEKNPYIESNQNLFININNN